MANHQLLLDLEWSNPKLLLQITMLEYVLIKQETKLVNVCLSRETPEFMKNSKSNLLNLKLEEESVRQV